jgi:hypothetical protein
MAKKESVSTGLLILLLGFTFWFSLEGIASKRLLNKLALATPGTKLADIKDKLGPSPRELEKLDEVLVMSRRIKDKQFCKGKKMYTFSDVVTPTCRGIQVYTDANDVIVYATWYQE